MIARTISYFNLHQIAASGQCFRMNRTQIGGGTEEQEAYRVISGAKVLDLVQRDSSVIFFCDEDEFPYWEEYFDLKTDYGAYIASIDEKDGYLRAAAEFGSGIRILKQDVWEMIITFVISQQKTIPNIRSLVEALCRNYGSRMEGYFLRRSN